MRLAIPTSTIFALVVAVALSPSGMARAQEASTSPLKGTWTLVAADVLRPDGSIQHDYGAAPAGRLMIDGEGRYALQIFDAARPRFASGDKNAGTPEEYRATVMGLSTHYGTLTVDDAAEVVTFHIEQASYANWNGSTQRRQYELEGEQLSYRVPTRPNGETPISVWRRISAD